MVKSEIIEKKDTSNKYCTTVEGVVGDTISETAAIIENIVASAIDHGGASFGREVFFDIFTRAAAFVEQKTGVDVTDEELDYKTRIEKDPIGLLTEMLGRMKDIDDDTDETDDTDDTDETEDDIPDFLF